MIHLDDRPHTLSASAITSDGAALDKKATLPNWKVSFVNMKALATTILAVFEFGNLRRRMSNSNDCYNP